MDKLKPCPFCGKEIDIDKDMYIPERDWKPFFTTLTAEVIR